MKLRLQDIKYFLEVIDTRGCIEIEVQNKKLWLTPRSPGISLLFLKCSSEGQSGIPSGCTRNPSIMKLQDQTSHIVSSDTDNDHHLSRSPTVNCNCG